MFLDIWKTVFGRKIARFWRKTKQNKKWQIRFRAKPKPSKLAFAAPKMKTKPILGTELCYVGDTVGNLASTACDVSMLERKWYMNKLGLPRVTRWRVTKASLVTANVAVLRMQKSCSLAAVNLSTETSHAPADNAVAGCWAVLYCCLATPRHPNTHTMGVSRGPRDVLSRNVSLHGRLRNLLINT